MRGVSTDDMKNAFGGDGFALKWPVRNELVQCELVTQFTVKPCVKIINSDWPSPLLDIFMRTCRGDELNAFGSRNHELKDSSLDLEHPLGSALGSRPIRLKWLPVCSRLVWLWIARSWVRIAMTESTLARS